MRTISYISLHKLSDVFFLDGFKKIILFKTANKN